MSFFKDINLNTKILISLALSMTAIMSLSLTVNIYNVTLVAEQNEKIDDQQEQIQNVTEIANKTAITAQKIAKTTNLILKEVN